MHIDRSTFNSIPPVATAAMESFHVPGAAIAALNGGELTYTKTLGFAHADKSPVTHDTYFEAASLTKTVFAYLVLLLEGEGVIDLDAPLTGLLPPPCEDERITSLTARHVLCHASGFPNWGRHPLPLYFAPGEGFRYSGEGYAYLQRCISRVTGRRLDDLLQEYVFDPLCMEKSAMIWTGALRGRLATSFDANGFPEIKQRSGARHVSGYEPNAAYSLYVTIDEYPRFLINLMKSDMCERIAATKNPAADGIRWGLGWGQYEELLWHWGDNGGFKSLVCFDRNTQDGLLIHTNGMNGLEMCYRVFELATGMSAGKIQSFIDTAE